MLKKQDLKILVASDMSDFNKDETLEYIDKIARRHYDMVIVIGDIEQGILETLNSQFDSALTALLPKSQQNFFNYTDGIEYFNLRKYHFSSKGTIIGYGGTFDNPSPVPIYKYGRFRADVLVSYYPPRFTNMGMSPEEAKTDPIGHNEVNLYCAYNKPKFIIHGGRKNNEETELDCGTTIYSVYGLQEFRLMFEK